MTQKPFFTRNRLLLIGGFFLALAGFFHIASKSFERQAIAAREAEARTYLGAALRGQQAYLLEASQFTEDLHRLGIGLPAETEDYTYTSELLDVEGHTVVIAATAKSAEHRSLIGAAYLPPSEDNSEIPITGLCINDAPGQSLSSPSQLVQSGSEFTVVCSPGSQPVS